MRRVEELVVFDLPLDDLYGTHWSLDGRGVPDAESPDEAVYLPGRNALLTLKPVLWCGMHGVPHLALATLAGNPFADATAEFFHDFETALDRATGNRVTFPAIRPAEKKDILNWGRVCRWNCPSPALPRATASTAASATSAPNASTLFVRAGYEDPTVYDIVCYETPRDNG